jgi:ABC-type amino acid transport substrate-binding protein
MNDLLFWPAKALSKKTLPQRMKDWILPLTLGIFLLGSLAATARAERVYRLAFDSAFLPFSGINDGVATGLGVDIVSEASRRAGLSVVLIPVPFNERIDVVKSGRADGIFPFPESDEYRGDFDFSMPLLMTGGAFFVLAPQETPAGIDRLQGVTVLTPRAGPLADYIRQKAPETKVVTTADYNETLSMLISGEAQVAALNWQVGSQLVRRNFLGRVTLPESPFWQLPLVIGVPKGTSSEFMLRFNRALEGMRADGTLHKINQRWEK